MRKNINLFKIFKDDTCMQVQLDFYGEFRVKNMLET